MRTETYTITKKIILNEDEKLLINKLYEVAKEVAISNDLGLDEILVNIIDECYEYGIWENPFNF